MNKYFVSILLGLSLNVFADIQVSLSKTSNNDIKCSVTMSAAAGTGCWPALVRAQALSDHDKVEVLSVDQLKKYNAAQLIDDNLPHALSSVSGDMPGAGSTTYIFNFLIPQAVVEEHGVRLFFNLYRAANPELTGGKKFTLCGDTLTALEKEVRITYKKNKIRADIDNQQTAELCIVRAY
jgi:hypothetical protein